MFFSISAVPVYGLYDSEKGSLISQKRNLLKCEVPINVGLFYPAKSGRWVAKLGRWVAKPGRWVAKRGDGWLSREMGG